VQADRLEHELVAALGPALEHERAQQDRLQRRCDRQSAAGPGVAFRLAHNEPQPLEIDV